MTRHSIKEFFIFLVFTLCCTNLFSEEIIDNELGYSLDFPEGFVITSCTEDGMSYLFEHTQAPVTFALKIYPRIEFQSSKDALSQSLKKLSAVYDIDTLNWSKKVCAVSSFSMKLDSEYSGWSISTPVGNDAFYLVCLCYCPSKSASIYNQMIISALNSLCIDKEFYNMPGIIVSYAFPKQGVKKGSTKIAGKNIEYKTDTSDEEAAQFLVELEYSVLILYAGHEKMNDAWQRYYKMIYRDNSGRLQDFCESVKQNIFEKYTDNQASIKTAADILKWTQNFEYKRGAKTESDFTNLVSTLNGKGNDCDSRSLIICTVMNYLGTDSILLFSGEYKHALAGVSLNAPGQKFSVQYQDGKTTEYLMGETTANVTFGTIAQEHADRSKWNFVKFN